MLHKGWWNRIWFVRKLETTRWFCASGDLCDSLQLGGKKNRLIEAPWIPNQTQKTYRTVCELPRQRGFCRSESVLWFHNLSFPIVMLEIIFSCNWVLQNLTWVFLSQMKHCWRNADEWHTLQERGGGALLSLPELGTASCRCLTTLFCYLLIMQQACRGRRESAFHYSHGCCSPRRRLAPMLEEQCHRAAAGLVLRGRRRFVMLSSEPLAAGLQLEPEQVNSVLCQHALGHRS